MDDLYDLRIKEKKELDDQYVFNDDKLTDKDRDLLEIEADALE
jgi:hypothetical protein